MEVFLVTVISMPTPKARNDDGATPTVIVPATTVIAKDKQQAAMKAMGLVPAEHATNVDRLEVRSIPFMS